MWGLGKAYGEIRLSAFGEDGNNFIFDAWSPEVWNSYCIKASRQAKLFQAFLNNEKIFESRAYEGQHAAKGASVFLLNDYFYDSPFHGSLTDLRIWKGNLTLKGEEKRYIEGSDALFCQI